MAKNPHDSRRENKLITGVLAFTPRIIVRGKVNSKPLKEGVSQNYSETRDVKQMSSPYL